MKKYSRIKEYLNETREEDFFFFNEYVSIDLDFIQKEISSQINLDNIFI